MSLVTKRMLSEEVSLAAYNGTDAYGYPTFATAATYSARVQKQRKQVRDSDGNQVISTNTVMLASGASPSYDDKLTLPDGSAPRIMQITEALDHKNVNHHWTIFTE